MAFTHLLLSYFQQEILKSRDTTVCGSYSTKKTGWSGGWHMVICFGIQHNYSIISLLIACPSLVDELVCVIMAYWNAWCLQYLPSFPCDREISFFHSPCVDCICRNVKDDHNPCRQVCQNIAKIAAKLYMCVLQPDVRELLALCAGNLCSAKCHPCLQNYIMGCRPPASVSSVGRGLSKSSLHLLLKHFPVPDEETSANVPITLQNCSLIFFTWTEWAEATKPMAFLKQEQYLSYNLKRKCFFLFFHLVS